MATKKKTQSTKREDKRLRTQQIVVVVFSVMIILAMILPMIMTNR